MKTGNWVWLSAVAMILLGSSVGCNGVQPPEAPALSSLRAKVSVIGGEPTAISVRLVENGDSEVMHGESSGKCPDETVTAILNDKVEVRSSFGIIENGEFGSDAFSCTGPSFRFDLTGLDLVGQQNTIRIRTTKEERVITLRQQAHTMRVLEPEDGALHPGMTAKVRVDPGVSAGEGLTISFDCSEGSGGFLLDTRAEGAEVGFLVPEASGLAGQSCEGKLRISSLDWRRWYAEDGDTDVIWDYFGWGGDSGILTGDSAWQTATYSKGQ
jgi:hypothetical protein